MTKLRKKTSFSSSDGFKYMLKSKYETLYWCLFLPSRRTTKKRLYDVFIRRFSDVQLKRDYTMSLYDDFTANSKHINVINVNKIISLCCMYFVFNVNFEHMFSYCHCTKKYIFHENNRNSHPRCSIYENTCAKVSFLNKVASLVRKLRIWSY